MTRPNLAVYLAQAGALALSLSLGSTALAAQAVNVDRCGVALSGFDPVAYLAQGKAVKGSKDNSAAHAGVVYWFSSAEKKALFVASPAKYLPTYGGWCATAMARGEKVEIDPQNFKVTNGRVFLFYKGLWGNARKDWDKDEPVQTTKADSSWKKISGE